MTRRKSDVRYTILEIPQGAKIQNCSAQAASFAPTAGDCRASRFP
jgi:hypothetical protein